MSTINVNCLDQTMTIVNSPIIASGGVLENYIEFTFCSEWSGFTKTAVFFADKTPNYYSVIDLENRCVIPHEVTKKKGKMSFGVIGVNEEGVRRTSQVLHYKIVEGGELEGAEPSDPTPDVWEQCLAQIGEAIRVAGNASSVPYVVTVTTNGEGGYVANRSSQEINKAFVEGKTVIAIADGVTLFALAATSTTTAIFRNLQNGNVITIEETDVTYTDTAFYTHPSFAARESGFYKITVDDEGHVSEVTKVTKKDITDLGIPAAIPEALKPLAHAETHKAGGADELKPEDIGAAGVENGKVLAAESSSAQNSVTASKTLELTDAGCDIVVSAAEEVTITIPTDDEVAFPIDTEIIIFRAGTGTVVIDGDSVTIWSKESARGIADQYSSVLLKKRAANTWSFEGNIG